MSLNPPTLLAVAVAAFALLIVIGLIRWTKKRTVAAKLSHTAHGDHLLAHDVEQVMVELNQLARQTHARLDAQFAKLDALSRAADERIDHLSRLVRAADGAPTIDLVVSDEDASRAHPLEATQPPDTNGQALSSTTGERGRQAEIHALSEAGLSPQQICEKTGQTAGEVELILSLRRMKRSAAVPAA